MHTFYVQFAPGSEPAQLADASIAKAAAAKEGTNPWGITFDDLWFQYNPKRQLWFLDMNSTIPQIPDNLAKHLRAYREATTVIEVVFSKGATPIDGRHAYQGRYVGQGRFAGCRAEVENRADKGNICQSLTVWGSLDQFVEFTNRIRQRRLKPTVWYEPR